MSGLNKMVCFGLDFVAPNFVALIYLFLIQLNFLSFVETLTLT